MSDAPPLKATIALPFFSTKKVNRNEKNLEFPIYGEIESLRKFPYF